MCMANTRPLYPMSPKYSASSRKSGEDRLFIPYWALDTGDLLEFLTGGLEGNPETAFTDKIFQLKAASHVAQKFPGVDPASITVDTPLPFSLKQLWYDLLSFEIATFEGPDRDQSTLQDPGDADTLTPPRYKPHAMGAAGPFLNQQAVGIQRPLNLLRSRLLDRRYDFLLRPGPWEPDLDGKPQKDLDELLRGWLGGDKPITVLDLSGVPSGVLERLVGSILTIVYEALFWSREINEGGIERPLLIVMEEAHRYLSDGSGGPATGIVQRIAKEGRKYGVGVMVVSQRPSEVNETVLSQCGTFFALRLSNPCRPRSRCKERCLTVWSASLTCCRFSVPVKPSLPGEAAKLPMRCRVTLPAKEHRPRSEDPEVSSKWRLKRRDERYQRVVASWRSQNPLAVTENLNIDRASVEDDSSE